ncbi:MAG: BrnT family toxin [Desulfobacterales bacterium]
MALIKVVKSLRFGSSPPRSADKYNGNGEHLMLIFEWDPKKAETNLKKHGVSFEEASTAFKDPLSLTIDDPLHSSDEERLILIGMSYNNRMLVIVHSVSGDNIRIISARKATKKERNYYETDVQ